MAVKPHQDRPNLVLLMTDQQRRPGPLPTLPARGEGKGGARGKGRGTRRPFGVRGFRPVRTALG